MATALATAAIMALIGTSSLLLCPTGALCPTTGATGRGRVLALMLARPAYTREAGDFAPINVALVERLISDRTALRRSKQYARADAVLGELRELDVMIDDDARRWSVTRRGDRRERSKRRQHEQEQRLQQRAAKPRKVAIHKAAPFTRSATCTAAISDRQQSQIAELVARRLEAKLARQFTEADAVLAELAELRVCVSDESHEWRADGRTFATPYSQEPGSAEGTAATTAEIESLISARSLAKWRRDYTAADLLLDQLLDLGAVVEDSRRVWRFVCTSRAVAHGEHDYQCADSEAELDTRLVTEVEDLLARRLDLKLNHRYEEADGLQGSLNALGVDVDDRAGSWTVAFAYTESSWRVRE